MTIAKRLILLLAVPIVALLSLGLLTRLELSRVEESSRFVADTQVPSLATLGELSRTFVELRVSVRNFILATNQAQQAEARSVFDSGEAKVNLLLQQYADHLISDEQDRRLLHDVRDSSHEWVVDAKHMM